MIGPSDLRQRHIVNPPIAAIPTRPSANRSRNRLAVFSMPSRIQKTRCWRKWIPGLWSKPS